MKISSIPNPEYFRAKSRLLNLMKNGFTLIELLVVLAIIAILAVLIIAVVKSSAEKVRNVGCINNLRQIGVALANYAGDHNMNLPYTGNEPHYIPTHLMIDLVGIDGKAGYLQSDGNLKTPWRSDVFLCPNDPNYQLYKNEAWDDVPQSYMYRQNEAASSGSRPINMVRSEDGYKRWIMMDRWVFLIPGGVAPYPGEVKQLWSPTNWNDQDTLSIRSYWHKDATNVLYEDGSVSTREWGQTLGK